MENDFQKFDFTSIHSLKPNVPVFKYEQNIKPKAKARENKRYAIYSNGPCNLIKHLPSLNTPKLPSLYKNDNKMIDEFQQYKSFNSLSQKNMRKKLTLPQNQTFYQPKNKIFYQQKYSRNRSLDEINSCNSFSNRAKFNSSNGENKDYHYENSNIPVSPISKCNVRKNPKISFSCDKKNIEDFFRTTYSTYGLGKSGNLKSVQEEDIQEKKYKLTKVNDINIFYKTVHLPKDKYTVPVLVYNKQKKENEENKNYYDYVESHLYDDNNLKKSNKITNFANFFHKRRVKRKQIFDNFRPYLVDDFVDFYEIMEKRYKNNQ